MIKNKILMTLFFILFFIIAIYSVWSDMSIINSKLNNIISVENKLQKIETFKKLIIELQRERGLTNIYYSEPTTEYFNTLEKQRVILLAKIDKLSKLIETKTLKKDIILMHKKIKTREFNKKDAFYSYTNIILDMLAQSEMLLLYTNDAEIKNHLIFYQQLNFIQEYIGQLRATIGGVLANKVISKERLTLINKLNDLVQNYIKTLNSYSNIKEIDLWKPIKNKKCVKETNNIINSVINKPISNISINALEWFKISTCVVDAINDNTNNYLNEIELHAKTTHNEIKTKLLMHSLFWIGAITITLITLVILFITNKKVLIEHRLLENYKKAIDNSTIVSKTDKNGKITYANKAFCEISGYSLDELIGKTHNILRHPDIDDTVFKDLWQTIENGGTWSGQIKNLSKNGETYWVNAAISPIYDSDNNIVEYIAIHHDITDLFKLNDEIQNTQHELIYRMGESVESRSKESGNHIRRVAMYSKFLGQLHGLDNQICEDLFIASTMHDMGKIAIPDSILLKPGKLNDEEWKIMKTHSIIGHKILSGSNLPILIIASDIALQHHERYDGKGYPRAMKGEDISVYARIVSIVDVFDALISDRVYKKAWEYDRVIKLFKNDVNEELDSQFDPILTRLFLDNIDKFMEIKQQFED